MQPKARILVVDDDEVARELLVEALQKEGYDVESFGSGQEATERGQQIPVDLVLTDIRMGAVDGFQVLREFKRIRPGTPIVLLTAFGSLEGAITISARANAAGMSSQCPTRDTLSSRPWVDISCRISST